MGDNLLKILAIDDNPDNLISFQALIKDAFHDAVFLSALNGKEGIILALAEDPDMIFLDIVMPDMDGFEVCKKLKADARLSNIPVVFTTALKKDKENRIRGLEAGAEGFLSKPIDEIELYAQIRSMAKIKAANMQKHKEKEQLKLLVEEQTSELRSTYTATLNLLEDLRNENEARKKTELELTRAKDKAESANKLKDAFIANISHEIRTPLNGILGMTSIIKDIFAGEINKEDNDLFEGIDISSKRIIRTVDMILNYSRLQVGEFNITPCNINISLICTNLVKEFITGAKYKSLDLTFQNNCGDAAIFADEYSITMAISSLIDNAIKFTKKGSINLILNKGLSNEIILEIKDSGVGINPEYLEHMFEPYRQEDMGYGRAYEGVGLGLAIVKKVIDLNNYVISVKSKKGEGTTFSINFGKGEQPLEVKYKKEIVPNIIPAPEELRKELVLLVEDDLMSQVTIRRLLENSYSVIITDSSDEAMEIIKKEKIDIILMDISIRGKKNGLELTKELKASKEFSHIPVIAVTAHAFEEDKQNALDAGCDSYLAKPFSKEALLNMIAGFARFTEKQK